jgi:DNA-binding LacI/PurR family transcriptional regulator
MAAPIKKRVANMEEIAQMLGVSIATVSRALNDQPGVSADTRQRVLELSEQLNYAPHGAARGLATTQTHTIAILTVDRALPLSSDYFYQRIVLGAQQALAERGYYLLVTALKPEELADLSSLRLIKERRVDGALLAGPEIPSRQILALRSLSIPVVLIDNTLKQTAIDCVVSEDEQGGYTAAHHLLEHGHQQIVVLTGPLAWPSNQARYDGYRRAILEHGLEMYECHESETTVDSGLRAMQTALAHHPQLTAVFAVNDSMAIGAMRALREQGRSIPKDVAVIGFDDIEWASHTEPPLTTLKVYKRQIGALAAQRMIQLIENGDQAPVRSSVGTTLIVRESCGCRPQMN